MTDSNITLPTRSEAEAMQDRINAVLTEQVNFWFVWTKYGRVPRFAHDTEQSAVAEAKRLSAKNRNQKFIVLRAEQKFHLPPIGAVLPPPTSEQMPDGEGRASQPDKAQVVRRGPLDMQVCVPKGWTDEQIKKFADLQNLCGTEHGWHIRKQGDEALGGDPERNPCQQSPSTHVHLALDA